MTLTTSYLLKCNEYECVNTLTTVQFMRVYQVAAHQICRKFLMASRAGLPQITCYWTPRKLKICGFPSANILRKPARDYIIYVNVGKQGFLRRLALQSIVPKFPNPWTCVTSLGWSATVFGRRLTVHTKQVSRYNRYIENISPNVGAETNGSLPTKQNATKRELERTIEDINHPNQVFFSKSSTSYSYNLRFKSGPVVIPRSGT